MFGRNWIILCVHWRFDIWNLKHFMDQTVKLLLNVFENFKLKLDNKAKVNTKWCDFVFKWAHSQHLLKWKNR